MEFEERQKICGIEYMRVDESQLPNTLIEVKLKGRSGEIYFGEDPYGIYRIIESQGIFHFLKIIGGQENLLKHLQ